MHAMQVLFCWTTSPVLRLLRHGLLIWPWLALNLWFFRLRLLIAGVMGRYHHSHPLPSESSWKIDWAEIVMIVRLVRGRLYLCCWSWQPLTNYSPSQEFYEAISFILGPLFFSWTGHYFHVRKPRHREERFVPKGTWLLSGTFWLVIIITEDILCCQWGQKRQRQQPVPILSTGSAAVWTVLTPLQRFLV